MSADDDFAPLLKRVADGETLGAEDSARAVTAIMTGEVSEIRIAAFLTALAIRKPTIQEIAGAAHAMRANMRTIHAPPGAIDMCGTGGDGHGTLNVSTAASFVVAACGVPVAKHGNRNMSSKTGAADVLEALGVKVDVPPAIAEACLREAHLCFLFGQTYHPAIKHVGNVRRALGFRTIFNLLGPLSNPAQVKRQLLGVFQSEWVEPVARVLDLLGVEKAWVVHGGDGMDEMTTTASTAVAILDKGKVTHRTVRPSDAGLSMATLDDIKGGNAEENASAIRKLLDGGKSAFRDIVLLNAAAALIVADKVSGLPEGVALAAGALDTGRAKRALATLVEVTQRAP